MKSLWKTVMGSALALPALSVAGFAAEGRSEPWQLGFQTPATEIMGQIVWFHDILMVIITVVTLFVMALLAYVMVKFSEKNNPIPSKTTHHTGLEIAWTIIPVLILVGMAIPSFRLLYAQYEFPVADVRVKAIGNQWSWDYEYPGTEVSFTAAMITDEDVLRKDIGDEEYDKRYEALEETALTSKLKIDSMDSWKKAKMARLLSVDNPIVVPVNKNIEVLVTAGDVLHNWTVPAFGVKLDAVPGRVLRTWFKATKEGVYYGQCSELCGVNHAFMPIEVRVVSDAVYAKWLATVKDDEEAARDVLAQAETDLANRRMAAAKMQAK